MYFINSKAHKCTKIPLKADFHPLEIPMEATLMGQYMLESSSGPSQGGLAKPGLDRSR